MEWQQLIADLFVRISQELERVLEGLTVDDLNKRPHPDCNSIGWLCWHLTRIQDLIITEIMGEEQLWIKDRWYATFKRAPDPSDTGWRHTSEDLEAFVSPDGETLLAYHRAVLGKSLLYTKNKLSETDLQRKSESPVLTSVNAVYRRLVGFIDEGFQHVGQAAYVRGLLKGEGWRSR